MNAKLNGGIQHGQKAWVVFSGQTDIAWLRILKPGFRHCFVLMNDGQCWISYDPMSHYTDITVHHVPCFFDMPGWLEGRGYRVLETRLNKTHKRPAPIGVFSCVEAVKRVLGIHHMRIITPWQLFTYLNKHNNTHSAKKEIFHGKSYIAA
tara:strand:- start:8365 stop:8814 length:450 start_codon:yes stop_codon:yes gene_type:complete